MYAIHTVSLLAVLIIVCVLQARRALNQHFTTIPVTEDRA